MAQKNSFADELKALSVVFDALEPLAEHQRSFVLTTVITRLGVTSAEVKVAERGGGGGESTGLSLKPLRNGDVSPKEFVKAKRPNSETQRMACLAFYLTHYKDQAHFKTRDLTNLNTDAACPKLSNPARTVDNATKQNGFFAPAGKGNKQITPYGEDVVKALPDQDAVSALRSEARPLRKRSSVKRKKGKKA